MGINPGFDDHYQRLIHQQAYAALRTATELDEMCEILGKFRSGLVMQGFSVEGAERMARELFILVSEQGFPDDGESDE